MLTSFWLSPVSYLSCLHPIGSHLSVIYHAYFLLALSCQLSVMLTSYCLSPVNYLSCLHPIDSQLSVIYHAYILLALTYQLYIMHLYICRISAHLTFKSHVCPPYFWLIEDLSAHLYISIQYLVIKGHVCPTYSWLIEYLSAHLYISLLLFALSLKIAHIKKRLLTLLRVA